jgi:hypothetical protein
MCKILLQSVKTLNQVKLFQVVIMLGVIIFCCSIFFMFAFHHGYMGFTLLILVFIVFTNHFLVRNMHSFESIKCK